MINVVLTLSRRFGYRYYLDSICETKKSFNWKPLSSLTSDNSDLLGDLQLTSNYPDVIYLQHSPDDKEYFIKPINCNDLFDNPVTKKYVMCATVTKRDFDGLLSLVPEVDEIFNFSDYLDTHFMSMPRENERFSNAITKELYTKDRLVDCLKLEYQDVWDHLMPEEYKTELNHVYNPTGRLEADTARSLFIQGCISDFFAMTNSFHKLSSFYEDTYPPDRFFSCHIIEDINGETLQLENLVNYGYAKHDGKGLFFTDHVFADRKTGMNYAPAIDVNGDCYAVSWNIFCHNAYDCDMLKVDKSSD